MKTFALTTLIAVSLLVAGCHDSRDEAANPLRESDFYKTIGEQIPFETGMEWMSLYKKQESSLGRLESLPDFHVPAGKLNEMLESVDDLTGVAFHYGLDSAGVKHIILMPITSSLSLWPTGQSRILIDANSGAEIDPAVAEAWAENFKLAHPAEIWFHFFGKEVFDEMRALPSLEILDIQPAISSIDSSPQLLLVIWDNETVVESGRTELLLFAIVYDASNACPPCAVY